MQENTGLYKHVPPEVLLGSRLLKTVEHILFECLDDENNEVTNLDNGQYNSSSLTGLAETEMPQPDEVVDNNPALIALLSRVLAYADEQEIGGRRYLVNYPADIEDDDLGNKPMWQLALEIYLDAFEEYASSWSLIDHATKLVVNDEDLTNIVATAYEGLNLVLYGNLPVEPSSSLIATRYNDRMPPYESPSPETDIAPTALFYLAAQDSLSVVEQFLCDVLQLPKKEGMHTPVGFNRCPNSPIIYLDTRTQD